MRLSDFSKKQPFTPTWGGNDKLDEKDRLVLELTCLDLDTLIDTQEQMRVFKPEGDAEFKPSPQQLKEMRAVYGPVIQKYVAIKSKSGDVTVDDIVSYAHFLDLCIEILGKLNKISQPTEQDVKN